MAKKGEARARITLKCTECGEENFRTEKKQKEYYRSFRIK